MATISKEKNFDTHIDIAAEKRSELIEILNQQLADTFDLYSQIKQAHWNVKGIHFMQLHLLFDSVAAAIEPYVDTIAERVTTLGGYATGTVRMAANSSTLSEYPTDAVKGEAHLNAVRDRVAAYAASTRQAIERASELGDPTTEDLFTEVSRVVDVQLYFIEGHLQG